MGSGAGVEVHGRVKINPKWNKNPESLSQLRKLRSFSAMSTTYLLWLAKIDVEIGNQHMQINLTLTHT